jgi:hypothetical protein
LNLNERLMDMVGHEVIINTREMNFIQEVEEDDDDVQENTGMPPGVLEEVGVDYVLLKTMDEDKGGFADIGAEWFVSLSWVASIIHLRDCKKCAIESAMGG